MHILQADTGFFKVFAVLEDFQKDIILTGNIYLDETFFSVVESKKEHRENGKEYRGISGNKLCIAAAYDEAGHILLMCENTSKPSSKSTWKHWVLTSNPDPFDS